MNDEPTLPADFATLAARAANEGIPIGAIARILRQPFDMIVSSLRTAHAMGTIGAVPKPDWPPSQKTTERLPTVPLSPNIEDVEFKCQQFFKLTNLEAGFLLVLLRYNCAEKDKLHGVIEQQRMSRPLRPDKQEVTDPKMVDVMICKLRKKLKAHNITVETSWGRGYFLDPSVKEAVYELIGASPHAVSPATDNFSQ